MALLRKSYLSWLLILAKGRVQTGEHRYYVIVLCSQSCVLCSAVYNNNDEYSFINEFQRNICPTDPILYLLLYLPQYYLSNYTFHSTCH